MVFGFLPASFAAGQAPPIVYFARGDVDANGALNLADPVLLLGHLFQGRTIPCLDAADADDNGHLDIVDPVHLLRALFLGGRGLPRPFRECGIDWHQDDLGCDDYSACHRQYPRLAALVGSLDAAVFVIDRSGSMQGYDYVIAKQLAGSLFSALPEWAEVGVVFFDRGFHAHPRDGKLAPATREARGTALLFLESMPPGPGTCPAPALAASLEMLGSSAGRAKGIVYLSDGGATCGGGGEESAYMQKTLEEVLTLNQGAATIHTVGIGELGALAESFLRRLAEQNGGEFLSSPE